MARKGLWIGLAVTGVISLGIILGGFLMESGTSVKAGPLLLKEQHPGYPENKEVYEAKTCRECHMESTPTIYQEWANSKHGVDNVRCFVCHGTLDEFTKVPAVESCRGCHAKQFDQVMLPEGKDKTCWNCHPAHSLSVHKTYKTSPSPLY